MCTETHILGWSSELSNQGTSLRWCNSDNSQIYIVARYCHITQPYCTMAKNTAMTHTYKIIILSYVYIAGKSHDLHVIFLVANTEFVLCTLYLHGVHL